MQVRVNATLAQYGQAGSIITVDDTDEEVRALVQAGRLTRLHTEETPDAPDSSPTAGRSA